MNADERTNNGMVQHVLTSCLNNTEKKTDCFHRLINWIGPFEFLARVDLAISPRVVRPCTSKISVVRLISEGDYEERLKGAEIEFDC